MANTSSAKKAQRAALKKRVFNMRRKNAVHSARKALQKSLSSATLATYQQALDKAAKTGVIPKNAVARMKSRMAKHLATAGKK